MYRLIFSCVLGVSLGLLSPPDISLGRYFQIILPVLIFSVGCSFGSFDIKKEIVKVKEYLLFPVFSITGSAIAGLLCTGIIGINLKLSLLAASSMGFYSLPAIMVSGQIGAEAGTFVLLVNMFREAIVILFAPAIKKIFGNSSLIAVGGATTMDVSLSVIKVNTGNTYITLAIVNGMILTIVVPFVISFILYVI